MRASDKNTDNMSQGMDKHLPGKSSIKWERTKEEVWDSMMDQLDSRPIVKKKVNIRRITFMAAAAAIAVLVGVTAIMRFYTREFTAGPGQQLACTLPDGSEVTLNAGTGITYNPFWWRFERRMTLEGEAFFDVVSGSKFIVHSELASTAVVGTSFNILARDNRYEVTCLSGRVRVFTDGDEGVLIDPDQVAVLGADGRITSGRTEAAGGAVSWKDGEFYFTSFPLNLVFEEIARQFDIEIIAKNTDKLLYTGNFSRNNDPEIVLDLVCIPFGIKFEKTKSGQYLIRTDETRQ